MSLVHMPRIATIHFPQVISLPPLRPKVVHMGGGVNHLLYQDKVNSLCASDMKGVGNQYVADGKVIIERKK